MGWESTGDRAEFRKVPPMQLKILEYVNVKFVLILIGVVR